jgi:hypothetical protein
MPKSRRYHASASTSAQQRFAAVTSHARRPWCRSSVVGDPLLDRQLVSTVDGALPVHTRVSVHLSRGWEQGFVTQTWATLGPNGKPLIMYKIAFDGGKEQEVDLGEKDAKLVTAHVADTPRARGRTPSYAEPRGVADGPMVGVANIPSPSKLSDLKVPELRRICTDLGLEGKGAKKDLVEQLTRAHATALALLSGHALATPAAAEGESEELGRLHALVMTLRAEMEESAAERAALQLSLQAKDAEVEAARAQLVRRQ